MTSARAMGLSFHALVPCSSCIERKKFFDFSCSKDRPLVLTVILWQHLLKNRPCSLVLDSDIEGYSAGLSKYVQEAYRVTFVFKSHFKGKLSIWIGITLNDFCKSYVSFISGLSAVLYLYREEEFFLASHVPKSPFGTYCPLMTTLAEK